jgi:hypothetical protein
MERIFNGDWEKFRSAVIFAGAVPSKDSGVDMFNSLSFESLGDHWGIAATDRYRLAWVGVNLSADEFRLMSADYRALISAPEILKAVKPAKVSAWHLAIDEDRRVWSLNIDGEIFGGDLVNGEGNYPKWRTLINPIESGASSAITFDPKLLSGLLTGISKAFGKNVSAKLSPTDADPIKSMNKPVLVSGFSDRAGALIMPIRGA